MSKIISIEGKTIKIGEDNGKILTVPIAALTFSNPKVGDEVEVFKDKKDTIVNLKKSKMNLKKPNVNKKWLVIAGAVVGGIILIVCAIKFLPLVFDEDLRTQSSYPEYYKNLKEEKEAFAKALEACNKAATSKMESKGIKTEYNWTDLDAVSKSVEKDDDTGVAYIYLINVQPTGGDKAYTKYGIDGVRDYDCEANTAGTSVQDVHIVWTEKN